MARTTIDLDDDVCNTIMERFHIDTKRDAVNFALRIVAGEALDIERARRLRGAGWEGDLETMRTDNTG